MEFRRRGDRSSGRSHQPPSFNLYRREAYNRQIDQHTSTSSDSNPARPLDRAGDNEQKQDLSSLKIEHLINNLKEIEENIYNEEINTMKIDSKIITVKNEWKKHISGEKVLSGLELEEFGKTVKAARAELMTLFGKTLPDLKTNLEAYQTEYNSRMAYPILKENHPRMKKLEEISSTADKLVVDHLVDLALISQKVERRQLRQNRNRVMKDSIPWGELDKKFEETLNKALETIDISSSIIRKSTIKNAESKYKVLIKEKSQELRNDDDISIIKYLIKNQKEMEKDGKTEKEIEDNLDKLYRERLKKENKQSKDHIDLVEKKQDKVKKEIEKFINEKVSELIEKSKLVKSVRSVRTMQSNEDRTSGEETSGARAVESGKPSQRDSNEIAEASSGTSRGVERRMGKAPISDSQSDKRFSEAMKKDLKIDRNKIVLGGGRERGHIIETKNIGEIGGRINNELESIKSALQKAHGLSSDLKLDILSGIQHRREQIETNWRQAITVDGRGKGNYDQRLEAAKRLKDDLKYLESIKKYVQEGEPLVGSKTEGLEPHINRDSYFTNDKLRIFGVFDGVGKFNGSDLAAKSASGFIKSHLEKTIFDDIDLESTKYKMRDTLKQANDGLERQKLKHSNLSEMGTTALVANIMKDGTVVIGNVGDCRALLIKRNSKDVDHLTLDNSHYNEMKLMYRMNTRDELLKYQKQIAQIKDFNQVEDPELKPIIKNRNTIGTCLGKENKVYVDMYEHKMERGDILILASDGITDNLTDQEIHAIIQKNKWNPGKATEDLVQRAQKISQRGESRSKPDDMTVVIATY